jgi:hypothetical protein
LRKSTSYEAPHYAIVQLDKIKIKCADLVTGRAVTYVKEALKYVTQLYDCLCCVGKQECDC